MIDRATLKRDVRACIMDWPVQGRYRGKELTVGLATFQDVENLMEGGLLDDMAINILAVFDDLGLIPKQREKFDVQMRDGKWKSFDIANVPDTYDPLSVTVTINLQSPHKG